MFNRWIKGQKLLHKNFYSPAAHSSSRRSIAWNLCKCEERPATTLPSRLLSFIILPMERPYNALYCIFSGERDNDDSFPGERHTARCARDIVGAKRVSYSVAVRLHDPPGLRYLYHFSRCVPTYKELPLRKRFYVREEVTFISRLSLLLNRSFSFFFLPQPREWFTYAVASKYKYLKILLHFYNLNLSKEILNLRAEERSRLILTVFISFRLDRRHRRR